MSSESMNGPRIVRVAGWTCLVQCFSSLVQYNRYSPGSCEDCRAMAWLQAETLFTARTSLISCVPSNQGPGNCSDGKSFAPALATPSRPHVIPKPIKPAQNGDRAD